MSSLHMFSSRTGILAMHRMVQNPFAVKDATPTRSMMADSTENKDSRPIISPPTFNPGQNDADSSRNRVSSSFLLKPPMFSNPFKKAGSVSEEKPCEVSTTKGGLSVGGSAGKGQFDARVEEDGEVIISDEEPEIKPSTADHPVAVDRSSSLIPNADGDTAHSSLLTGVFGQNVAAPSGNEFVFGQNMNERVKNAQSNAAHASVCTNGSSPSGLFTQGAMEATSKVDVKADDAAADQAGKYSKSLTESALEYEQRQVKRTYEEVAVVTGEEEESNVLQMNCKLFAFDKGTGTWVERGHGLLRLNDKELEGGALQSRLVMRTQGSLRVILNTKVWGAMSVDRPSSKSVRITAIDGDSIKVFLIMASPKDSEQLFGALDWRMATLKSADDRKAAEGESVTEEAGTGASSSSAGDDTESPSGSGSGACTTSLDAQGPSTSTKKRRVTPPMSMHADDSSSGSGLEPQLQEKKVDSTRDSFTGSGSGLDDSCQDLP